MERSRWAAVALRVPPPPGLGTVAGVTDDATSSADGEFRIEHDTMGEVRVPAAARWGAQTQRAVENFPVSGARARAVADRRARPHQGRGGRGQRRARGRRRRRRRRPSRRPRPRWCAGDHDDQFPVDVFQTGSGTSSNMNANEVIARLAAERLGRHGPPQRRGQRLAVVERRVPVGHPRGRGGSRSTPRSCPALEYLRSALRAKAQEFADGGEVGAHPPDGRHAGDARPGVRRLRRPGRPRGRRHPRDAVGRGRAAARRHRRRHRPELPAGLRRGGRRPAGPRPGAAADRGARPLRRPGRPRRAGRPVGRAAHAGGRAGEDRQRHPLDGAAGPAPGWPRSACPTCSPGRRSCRARSTR